MDTVEGVEERNTDRVEMVVVAVVVKVVIEAEVLEGVVVVVVVSAGFRVGSLNRLQWKSRVP